MEPSDSTRESVQSAPKTPPASHSSSSLDPSGASSQPIPQTTPSKGGTSTRITGYINRDDLKRDLREEMKGMDHPFDQAAVDKLLNEVKSSYEIDQYLSATELYDNDWTAVPTDVETPGPEPVGENRIYKPLCNIFNDILGYFNLSDTRCAHVTSSSVKHEDGDAIRGRPDLLVVGRGSQFRCQGWGKGWRSCVSFIDGKQDKDVALIAESKVDWEDQFGKYARHQPTRIFLYTIIFTEKRFRLYRYDRCGILYSDWLNYRESGANLLVRAILLVSSSCASAIGFDDTVTVRGDNKHVFRMKKEVLPVTTTTDGLSAEKEELVTNTKDSASPLQKKTEDVELTEVNFRWSSFSLIGRATTCWTVIDNATGETRILKQQYVNVNRTPEHEILGQVQGIKGVVKVYFAQRIGKDISQTRQGSTPEGFHDRFLYRLVLEEYGDPIYRVTDFSLLLKALRDAIKAHQEAYCDRKILHRDISIRNILYAKDPNNLREGEALGNLIDFELGIRIDRTSSCHMTDFQTGTRAFHSVGILEAAVNNLSYVLNYIDDLQAFLWVLVWILDLYDPTPDESDESLRKRFQGSAQAAFDQKDVFLHRCTKGTVSIKSRYPHPVVLELILNLGSFFAKKMEDPRPTTPDQLVQEARDVAPGDYKEVLDHFQTAIDKLPKAPPIQLRPVHEVLKDSDLPLLLLNLGSFFMSKRTVPRPTTPDGLLREARDMAPKDYQKVLDHFATAIDKLPKAPPIKLRPVHEVLKDSDLPLQTSKQKAKSKKSSSKIGTGSHLQTSSLASSSSSYIPPTISAPESSPPRKKARTEQGRAA
ncbi:hypothetical protein CVT24_002287 [Panaeolus cyanescens]|uniref:Fungal-type protein kinase domain-containing protein n=1 Tax=Panaeolus cyanescens TaxID=181874 RepID=A0A409YIK2_9AGAR|nr:hypothetical protein CVT24_002287 [Panaeolus cyanescens]